MCLFITIELSKGDAIRGVEIAEAATVSEGFGVYARKKWFRKEAPILTIEDGCACHLLEDSADWDAPTWDMTCEELPKLAATLKQIDAHCFEPFVFEALWVGDKPQEQKRVSIDELNEIILAGKVGTKTSYLVYPKTTSLFL